MNRSIFETILGIIIVAIAIVFGAYAYTFTNNNNTDNTQIIQAYFNQSGGLNAGSDVRMAGVRIGSVSSVSLDNENFLAHVKMRIQKNIILPKSTIAEIASDGLIGGKYVRITPKNKTGDILPNNTLQNTKDVETLEQLLGKVIFLTQE